MNFGMCSGILKDHKCQKVLLLLTWFVFQIQTFQPCFLLTIDRFLFEADYSFLSIKKFVVFYIRFGIPVDQNWESAISSEKYRYSNLSFSKTTHLKLLPRSELTVKCLSDGIIRILSLTME